MADDFKSFQPGLEAPAQSAAAITPSDSQPLANATRAIYIGGAGNLSVSMVDGSSVTLTGLVAGMIYPLRLNQVFATGTTATGLVGLR